MADIRDPKINIYNCDNLPEMKLMEDNQFDLAFVDPQYGLDATNMQMGSANNRKGKNQYPGESTAVKIKRKNRYQGSGTLKDRIFNRSDLEWDKEPPPPEYFTELFRVSKNQIIWGGNYFPLPPTRGIIIWDKVQSWDNFSQVELAWTSFDRPAKLYRICNRGGDNKEPKISPTQKPVELYSKILQDYAEPGWSVLDTHLGSGSIAIACWLLGFDLTGYEKAKSTYDDAMKRINYELKQGVLDGFR